MATIELNNEQLRLIQKALDLYARIGILQFDIILEHPTIDEMIIKRNTVKKELEIGDSTLRGEIVELSNKEIKTKGRWGNGEEIKAWTDIENIKLSPDWKFVHSDRDEFKIKCSELKKIVSGENFGTHGNMGIYNPKVDESARDAHDLVQVIRHEFWKANPKRSSVTVDSSLHINSKNKNVKVLIDE